MGEDEKSAATPRFKTGSVAYDGDTPVLVLDTDGENHVVARFASVEATSATLTAHPPEDEE